MQQYPGLGLPLRQYDQPGQIREKGEIYPIGIHPDCDGSNSAMLLVREVAMMMVMNNLTDKPNWEDKVFDDVIAEKWIEEALAIPVNPLYDSIARGKQEVEPEKIGWVYPQRLRTVLDRSCLEYCIKELRAKAEFFKVTGLILTLDASASIVKSDTLVDETLKQQLRQAFAKIQADQTANPDWHPGSDGKVLDLVHPSLYPLIYGKSPVFQDEVVGVDDAVDNWAGKGETISAQTPQTHQSLMDRFMHVGTQMPQNLWSNSYQWLPSNVQLVEDGTVRFTSYINNLHPTKYRPIYRVIERLIEKALPAWENCVIPYNYNRGGRGPRDESKASSRTRPRYPIPENPDDENDENWDPPLRKVKLPEAAQVESKRDDEDSLSESDTESEDEEDSEGHRYSGTRKMIHWCRTRVPVQPETPTFQPWKYGVEPGQSLRDKFKDLQVIVKMASIELTPEKPVFPQGSWHVEGMLNEKIVGTALYYLDSENVTSSYLDFRMQTTYDQYELQDVVGQDSFGWLELVYGTTLRGGSCLQNYGSVETKEGRLIAFPNTFQHRVSSFELQDRTKPGHRRFIAIWLVDPHNRIISTANVPPQQRDWWLEKTFSGLDKAEAEKIPQTIARLILERAADDCPEALRDVANRSDDLPPEIFAMVRAELGDYDLPMSLEEAKEHRLKLMEERTHHHQESRTEWGRMEYNFCEH
ncbi:hypothetical protein B0I35DRAFT_467262 [Stachybotrys elegans]|uniref:Uncharacterized protein n=1 Tax=Stachybotrys elegans TaxID=80388 RepID=A0A8K0WTR8_9HYPO|nr:hypothetical protein B0I35DRAFT_467262 [Stachybotrys elegans]